MHHHSYGKIILLVAHTEAASLRGPTEICTQVIHEGPAFRLLIRTLRPASIILYEQVILYVHFNENISALSDEAVLLFAGFVIYGFVCSVTQNDL